jgi:hypothetical protein
VEKRVPLEAMVMEVTKMSREFLREIEEKYGRMLDSWNRTKGMDGSFQFIQPYVLPPEENVIQGLRKPDPPKAKLKNAERSRVLNGTRLGECYKCDFLDKISAKCLLKRLKGEDACIRNGVENRRSVQAHASKPERLPKAQSELCRFCSFSDKRSGYCLIKRVNGESCPFARKRNGKAVESAP